MKVRLSRTSLNIFPSLVSRTVKSFTPKTCTLLSITKDSRVYCSIKLELQLLFPIKKGAFPYNKTHAPLLFAQGWKTESRKVANFLSSAHVGQSEKGKVSFYACLRGENGVGITAIIITSPQPSRHCSKDKRSPSFYYSAVSGVDPLLFQRAFSRMKGEGTKIAAIFHLFEGR